MPEWADRILTVLAHQFVCVKRPSLIVSLLLTDVKSRE